MGLLYQPWLIYADNCIGISETNEWHKKLKYSERTCPSVAPSITDPTRLHPELSTDRRGGTKTANRLRDGKANLRVADRVIEHLFEGVKSASLLLSCLNITITVLEIIDRPVFCKF
jgi:hypothetical protein